MFVGRRLWRAPRPNAQGEIISIMKAMSLIMSAITTIPLRRETRNRLREMGKKGETYDAVVVRLLEQAELAAHLEKHYERLREKSRFVPLDEI